jgi:opacity protein-like surface antigen
MIGISAWADYNIFHGLGIEAEGTTIFAAKPSSLTRMKQDTIKGGVIYKWHPIFGVRPYGKYLYGLASIDFPSRNPLYTHDTYTMSAAGGGVEYRVWHTLNVRADYEYQFWQNFQGRHTLNPNGFTLGATYYLRGIHRHY